MAGTPIGATPASRARTVSEPAAATLPRSRVRCGPEQAPCIASEPQRGDRDHPDRPELAVRPARGPDDDAAQIEDRDRAGVLVDPPARQLARAERGRQRTRVGKVGADARELGHRGRGVRGFEAFAELGLAQTPCRVVLAQVRRRVVAVAVGGAELGQLGHPRAHYPLASGGPPARMPRAVGLISKFTPDITALRRSRDYRVLEL